jgi:hypothetical protein
MYTTMYGERSSIYRVVTLHHFSFVINANQIVYGNLGEVDTEWINPKCVFEFRITRRDVPGNAFPETKLRKDTEGAR